MLNNIDCLQELPYAQKPFPWPAEAPIQLYDIQHLTKAESCTTLSDSCWNLFSEIEWAAVWALPKNLHEAEEFPAVFTTAQAYLRKF